MAISWDVTITNVNLVSKRGDVTATRTDDQSALEPRVYVSRGAPLETVQDRTRVLDTIKEWDESAVSKTTAVTTFIDNLEQSAKTNLENWELTR
jgi:hypothetical protein